MALTSVPCTCRERSNTSPLLPGEEEEKGGDRAVFGVQKQQPPEQCLKGGARRSSGAARLRCGMRDSERRPDSAATLRKESPDAAMQPKNMTNEPKHDPVDEVDGAVGVGIPPRPRPTLPLRQLTPRP